jgi:hypothetical protein
MQLRRDNLLLVFGILSILVGVIWGILMEIALATVDYPVSAAEIIAGLLITVAGILLLYQKGKGVYYAALTTSIVAAITFLFITPYVEDYATGAFCIIVIIVIAVRRGSFEARPLMSNLLGVVRDRRRVRISDLAAELKCSEADVELAIINLRSKGAAITFEAETREVVYG